MQNAISFDRPATAQEKKEIDPRVKALYRYQILKTPSEAFFRNIAETTAKIFNCKLGIISFIDDETVFYKEVCVRNTSTPDFTGALMPHSLSPCSFAVHNVDVTVMDRYPDDGDPAWEAYNLQVTKFGLKFYAGTPLRTPDGLNIGMLALVDEDIRLFTDRDRELLNSMAKIVVDELELRLSALNEIYEHKRVNLIIEDQNKLISGLNRELQSTVEELKEANHSLADKVYDKTKKLSRVRKALVLSQREMDALVYNASHGLKSPVTTIDGLINVARMEVTDELALDYLKRIDVFTKKMKGTVHKLTMIYNIINRPDEMGFNIAQMTYTDFQKAIENVISVFRGELMLKGIEVNVNISNDISFTGVPSYLDYILYNLFENSVSFYVNRSPAELSFININVEGQGDKILLSIHDNGEGIPKECCNKIFSMFFRASDRSGPGLGLYIVKKIIDKMEGDITFTTTKGSFTHFTAVIPKFK